jgi:hypothetical protein
MHTMAYAHATPAHSDPTTTPTSRRRTTLTVVRADTHPPTPMPMSIWRVALARWQQALAVSILLGVLVMTLRAAIDELGVKGVWLTIGSAVLIGIPAAIDACDGAHGQLPPRTRKWT